MSSPRLALPRPAVLAAAAVLAALAAGCTSVPDEAGTPAEPAAPGGGVAAGAPAEGAGTAGVPVHVPDRRVAPLAEAAAQGDEGARAELTALAAASGAAGDQAALALGALLAAEERWAEALPPLRRAAAGDPGSPLAGRAAAVLFARAVVEGNLAAELDAARRLVAPVASPEPSALAAEARLRAFQLESLAGAWPEAARRGLALLAGTPAPAGADEVRWLTAEALRLAGREAEAVDLYREIWQETPGSAWAREARERLVAAGAEPEPPAGGERLAWIDAMQSAGLHREALEALAPLRRAAGDPELARRAQVEAAESHWVLRENDEVVAVAEALRRAHPESPEAAAAALQAMRALGRNDRVAEIRAWERWLRQAHPGHEATPEARYYLGVILGGTEGEEEAGLELLGEVAAAGGERAADALWRIAWIERRLGDDAAARQALERLLAAEGGGGYRSAALYWLARLAPAAERQRAAERYETVRREFPRNYYARAAEDRLRELGFEPQPIAAEAAAAAATEAGAAQLAVPPPDPLTDPTRRPEPAYRRGVELAALGLPRLAAAELATLDLDADPPLALGVARLHHEGGDTWSAIGLLLGRFDERLDGLPLDHPGVAREVWETLYPFPYRDAVAAAVESSAPSGHPFDPWLVATVARRESRFWPRAASPAGAVGVLQLLPGTAAGAAERAGVPAPGRDGLFDPEVNIALGTAELARLVAAFDGHWAPALAAYNAGEPVVRGWWQARPPGQTLDEWIDTIPYVETRLYVKWILGTHPIYRALYPQI